MLGASDIGPDEEEHSVVLAPFFMARHEVTQAQWERGMGNNPARYSPGFGDTGDFTLLHPVESVSWTECDQFVRRLALRLPTEDEWEFACRAGTVSAWSWGNSARSLRYTENIADLSNPEVPSKEAWNDGFPFHAPVGSLEPNAFGLHDMHGNVTEWCESWYTGFREEWILPSRIFRGGSWYTRAAPFARSAYRAWDVARANNQSRGLRVARSIDEPRQRGGRGD